MLTRSGPAMEVNMAVERIATGGRAFLVFVFYLKRGLSYADAYRFFCDSRGDGRGPEMKDVQNVLCYIKGWSWKPAHLQVVLH